MTMRKIRTILDTGGVVILPTETVYGLFARALDEKAVEAVYRLKQRPRAKAMNLNVADYDDIVFYSQNPPSFLKKIYQVFMPGPLTVILPANDKVPFWINSGGDTVGFRIPNHQQTLQLIRETGPLIGPSANISGHSSGISYEAILQEFGSSVTGLADDSAITGVDSTILDLTSPVAKILRQGQITQEEIQQKVPDIVF